MSDQHNIDMNNEFRNERQERLRDANLKLKALTPAEMAELRDKNTRLQSEVERLRGRMGEFAAFVQEVAERQLDPDFVMSGVESDMKLLLEQSRAITQEDEECDYESPWLLRKQAEAVEGFRAWMKEKAGDKWGKDLASAAMNLFIDEYKLELGQQADEAEKAGG